MEMKIDGLNISFPAFELDKNNKCKFCGKVIGDGISNVCTRKECLDKIK